MKELGGKAADKWKQLTSSVDKKSSETPSTDEAKASADGQSVSGFFKSVYDKLG